MNLLSIIDELEELLQAGGTLTHKQMFVGLDGYVDRIQKVVQSQADLKNKYFDNISALAERIGQAAGKSAQLELVNQTIKAGGNAPIMAHALGRLGLSNHCLGNFGEDSIHPVFQSMSENCTLLSLGNPAETNALEFDDGKLILSEVSAFSKLDWNYVLQKYSANYLSELMDSMDMLAFVDWCNLPLATNIWQGVLKDILPKLDTSRKRQYFFDLADPSKKSVTEIINVMEVMSAYNTYGPVTLGLNENEAYRLAQALMSIESKAIAASMPLEDICQYIFDRMKISFLLVHPLDRTLIVSKEGIQNIKGRLVKKPRISTGGGDNLNAGFCFARLAGCSTGAAAVLGMATSGAYVQEGQSPDLMQLKAYLEKWKAELSFAKL
ncbi:hypothetical protein WJR50_26910 [Catalinimonas sp. 4WD22]|uniref:hypothetical protein n=1 Tax=Catalinimonas locisalis TaxID=3133978 RepID=UPI003100FF60